MHFFRAPVWRIRHAAAKTVAAAAQIFSLLAALSCVDSAPGLDPGCEAGAKSCLCKADNVCNDGLHCYSGRCVADQELPATCGDGLIDDEHEVCDDGNAQSGDGCAADCRSDETCGNGVLDPVTDEQCDDGNETGGDGCSAACLYEVCGNNVVDTAAFEVCDDGNNDDGDGCAANCRSVEECGDGALNLVAGEGCDDGGRENGDGCSGTCQLETCGNGVLDPIEACDDGNNDDGDGCAAHCRSQERCGNEIVDRAAGEQCDDGGNEGGDGCSTVCHFERCGNGVPARAVRTGTTTTATVVPPNAIPMSVAAMAG